MSANSINSISEFLLHAGTEYHVFDLGRRIEPTDNQTFLEIENGSAYAPYPRQQHAWFGIVFWNKNASSQHYIWFVKLPLDEQGLIVAAARNHFLEIIVDALGKSIAEDTENAQQLPDNPYSFVPNQSQLAQFNALVKSTLNHPLSEEGQKVEAYVQAPQLVDWQQISMQSVADFIHGLSVHAKRAVLEEAIKANVALYSDVFVNTLMETSESVSLSDNLLAMYLSKIDDGDDINLAALRGASEGNFNPVINSKLLDLLKNEKSQRVDILSVIAARHFEQMEPLLLSTFLEQAAKVDEKEDHQGALFAGFFSDLVQIPKLRRQVLTLLHSDANSDILSEAFQRLFAQARK